jgi:hypothetical protein
VAESCRKEERTNAEDRFGLMDDAEEFWHIVEAALGKVEAWEAVEDSGRDRLLHRDHAIAHSAAQLSDQIHAQFPPQIRKQRQCHPLRQRLVRRLTQSQLFHTQSRPCARKLIGEVMRRGVGGRRESRRE